MKFFRSVVTILASLIVLLLIVNKVCSKYPDYILFKSGISKSDIVLQMNKSIYYNVYLYESIDNSLKYIVIGKANSSDYGYTVKQNETLPMNNSYNLIHSAYSDVAEGGTPVPKSVLAGYIDTDKIKNPQFLLQGGDSIIPTLTSHKGNILYFIHDVGYPIEGRTSEMLKVKSSD